MSSIVLLSGGQDSVTCLAWAKSRLVGPVHALTINYGQRHVVELECAKKAALEFKCATHTVIDMPDVFPKGFSAMNSPEVPVTLEGSMHLHELPSTFLPGRNIIFLAIAAAHAAARKADEIVIGVCETDYSGYPDCRQRFIDSMMFALEDGLDQGMEIRTPLMNIDKAATFALANELHCLDYILEHTHTCYMGDRSVRHAWGYGCGKCPACNLRKQGWDKYVNNTKA